MEKKTSPKSIGLRIKELREKKGESQKELAHVLSCQQNNVAKIENGGSQTFTNLLLIAEHYNVSLDYLCKGEGGADMLDTLNNYIRYKISKTSGIGSDDKSHLIPHLEINNSLYNCIKQIALAENSSEIPQSIKSSWIQHAKKEFHDNMITDHYREFITLIPLEQSVLNEKQDVISLIEKHLYE